MHKLTALGQWMLGNKQCFVVESPVEAPYPLVKETVAIDRRLYYVEAIERHCHAGPVLVGERISLVCTPVSNLRKR